MVEQEEKDEPVLSKQNSSVNSGNGLISKVLTEEKLRFENVDDLFGKILGIERVLLADAENDLLIHVIEKISLVPEHKLLFIEPLLVTADHSKQVRVLPSVRGVLTISDLFQLIVNSDASKKSQTNRSPSQN